MSVTHFSENPCGNIGFKSIYSANRFNVTCKMCQKKNNILPKMMGELIDKTFGVISGVQGLDPVFERAKVRFVKKMQDNPLKNHHPWDTETTRELIGYMEEEYDEVKEAFEKGFTVKCKQMELLDLILTASFLYLKLEKRKNEVKQRMEK